MLHGFTAINSMHILMMYKTGASHVISLDPVNKCLCIHQLYMLCIEGNLASLCCKLSCVAAAPIQACLLTFSHTGSCHSIASHNRSFLQAPDNILLIGTFLFNTRSSRRKKTDLRVGLSVGNSTTPIYDVDMLEIPKLFDVILWSCTFIPYKIQLWWRAFLHVMCGFPWNILLSSIHYLIASLLRFTTFTTVLYVADHWPGADGRKTQSCGYGLRSH